MLQLKGSWHGQMGGYIILVTMISLGMGMWSMNHRLNSVTFVGTFGKEACFSTGIAKTIEYKSKAAGSHLATT